MSKVSMIKLSDLDIEGKYRDIKWRLSESSDPDFLILSITFGHSLLLSKEYSEENVTKAINKKGFYTFIGDELDGFINEMKSILQYLDHMELKNKE